MAVAEVHPSAEDLTAFTLGTLEDETQAFIEDHVATCTSCQDRAATAPGDSFVELVRSVRAQPSVPADTETEAMRVHTPAPGLRDAVGAAPTYAVSADSDAADDLNAIPPELARHERYRVMRLLGEGGMGSVYEAEQIVMQRRVALKVIRRACTASPAALERFRREVRAAALLSHPNIVTAYDAETAGELHFLVMEYVEGISLAWLVKERGPLPIEEACEYVRQAALGLQHAHERGLVHRDIKPDNLIRCSDGTVKILDFGLAALTAESGGGLTEANVVMGTPEYMAPEQAEDSHKADIRADLYSLGCTLYYLLTGKPPYPAPTPLLKVLAHRDRPVPSLRRARPDVPPELAAVVERLLAKKPEDRYQTPRDVAAALQPFTRSAVRPRRKRGSLLVAAAVAALFAVIVLAGAAVYRIATDKGELVIETDNDDVEVVVSKGGQVVKIIDAKSGKQVTLNSGDYELALKDGQEGLKLSLGKMTLKRGETVLATIERVTKPVPKSVGEEIRRFGTLGHPVRRLALSPDGKRLLTAGCQLDGTARYWDIATGKEIYRLPSKGGQVYGVAISPDGTKLLSCSGDRLIHVWDAATGQEVKQLKGHTGEVLGVAISPDGRMVASSGWDCQLRLWNLDTGELIASPGKVGGGWGTAFSPDGKLIATWGVEHIIRLWDAKNLKEVRRLEGHKEWVLAAAFSGDGSRLLSGTWPSDGSGPVARPSDLKLWEVRTGKLLRTIDLLPGDNVHGLAISPDGRQALSCSGTGGPADLVELWDLERGKPIVALRGHIGFVGDVAFLPGGRTAVSGGYDATIRLWRLPESAPAKENP